MCVCVCVTYWARRQQISQETQSLHQHVCVRVRQQAEQLFCTQTLDNLPLHLLISLKCQVLNTIMVKVTALDMKTEPQDQVCVRNGKGFVP